MNDNLISYSIISVTNGNNMDYFSNFTPFIKDSLKSSSENVVCMDYVQEKLKEIFSLDIHSGIIRNLFDRPSQNNYIIDTDSYI